MKILITSGGTKVKIDLVRSITNMSRGTFGSQICDSFWRKLITSSDSADKNEIVFFYAKNSRMPTAESQHNSCYDSGIHAIRYIEYDTFDDYRTKLTDLLKAEKFDIIVLAAAVSDYGVANYFNGKYHSSDDMTIKLVKLPKVITEVRALAPNATICGFKLLVNSTDEELRAAMNKQFAENGIELCVGNDLRDIKANDHRLTIKFNEKLKSEDKTEEFMTYTKSWAKVHNCKLADIVVDKCIEANKLKREMKEKA